MLSKKLFDLGAITQGRKLCVALDEPDDDDEAMRELLEDEEFCLTAQRGSISTCTRQTRAPDTYGSLSATSWSSAAVATNDEVAAASDPDSESEEEDEDEIEEEEDASVKASALADFVRERKQLRTAAQQVR